MSKMWRNILIVVAVVAVLGGALAFLLLNPPAAEPDDGTTDDGTDYLDAEKSIPLITVKTDANAKTSVIQSAEITSKTFGTFKVKQNDAGELVVEGQEDLARYDTRYDTLEELFTSLAATKKISDNGNPADYGLDTPQVSVSVTFTNGKSYAFAFGDLEPYGTGNYFRFADSNEIYLVSNSLLESLNLNPHAYIDTTLYTSPALPEAAKDETVSAVLRDISFGGSFYGDTGFAMRLVGNGDPTEYMYTSYVITAPYVHPAATEKAGEELMAESSLTADLAIVPHYTAKDLETYGLATPYITATLHTAARISSSAETEDAGITFKNVEEHVLSFSKPDKDGNVYVILDKNPTIFRISTTMVPWFEMTYEETVSPILFLKNITSVDRITVTANGKDTAFKLTHKPASDEEDTDTLSVTANGAPVSASDFRNLYQLMMGISRSGSAQDIAVGALEMRIQLYATDGTSLDISIYNAGASVCVVDNGEERYKVAASGVRNFKTQLENLLNGKTVIA